MVVKGDMVTWTISNIRRIGQFWAVILPRHRPDIEIPDGLVLMFEVAERRDQTSYIVESLSGLGGQRRLYRLPADRPGVVARSGAEVDLSQVRRVADRLQVAEALAQWRRLQSAAVAT